MASLQLNIQSSIKQLFPRGAWGLYLLIKNALCSGQKLTCLSLGHLTLRLNILLLYFGIILKTQSDSCFPSFQHSPESIMTSSVVSSVTSTDVLPGKSVKDLPLLENVILHGSFEIESAQRKALWQELNAVSWVASGSFHSKANKSETAIPQRLSLVELCLTEGKK